MNYISMKEILERTKNLVLLDNQKNFREQVAAFISSHCMRVKCIESGMDPTELPNISMIAIASSGSGKTYVTSRLAKAAGVKVITVDCASLSRTGWRGVNLGRLIDVEFKGAQSKEELETCIIHFDEFDKACLTGYYHADAGNPQPDFLKLFDGEILCEGDGGSKKYNTSRMAFLFTGAFSGLDEIIKRRVNPRRIGFSTAENTEEITDYLAYVTPEDLTAYGLMEELLGRIGLTAHIPRLSENDYKALIRDGDGSVCKRFDNLLKAHGVAVDVSEEACSHLAAACNGHNLGARAAVPTFQKHVLGKLKDIEANTGINRITLDYADDVGYFVKESYGKRVYPKEPEEKPAPSLEGWVPRDISFAGTLWGKEGVKRSVKEVMAVYARTGLDEFDLMRSFLSCVMLYFKYHCNDEDQCLGNVMKLARITRKDENGSTFSFMMRQGIKKMHPVLQNGEQLQRSLDKFEGLCPDNLWAGILIKHVDRICECWYTVLCNRAKGWE